jgi:ribose 5-phosphate isomerase RpiB
VVSIQRFTSIEQAVEIVDTFLDYFEGGRHQNRVIKLLVNK